MDKIKSCRTQFFLFEKLFEKVEKSLSKVPRWSTISGRFFEVWIHAHSKG